MRKGTMSTQIAWGLGIFFVYLCITEPRRPSAPHSVSIRTENAPERLPVSTVHAAASFHLELVEGWTGDLDFQLQADGSAIDLTGMTVAMLLYKSDGTTVDTTGDISVFEAATGKVRYAPDSSDLLAADSPLRSRFQVTDGGGKVVFFPNGTMDTWVVRSP